MAIQKLKQKLIKHRTSLPLFLFIGVIKTFSAVLFNWLFIDLLHMITWIGASLAYGIVFIGTYIAYVKSKTIHKGFVKYTIVVVAFNLLSILLVTILVEKFGLAGYSSSTITTAILVLLRYFTLHKFGVINTNDDNNEQTKP